MCFRHQIYGAVTPGIMGGDYQGATHINLFLHCVSVMHLIELNAGALFKLHLSCYTGVLSGVRDRNCRTQRMFTSIQRIKVKIGRVLSE